MRTRKTPAPHRTRTLKNAWASATARLLLIIVALGMVSLAAARHQHVVFAETTAVLEHDMRAVVDADMAHLAITEPATAVMYGFGGGSLEDHLTAYAHAASRVEEELDHLDQTVSSSAGQDLVDAIRASWQETDAGVRQASEMTSEDLAAAFASGQDPHAETVWASYNMTVGAFSELGHQIVVDLSAHADEAAAAQRLVIPAVVVALVIAVIVAVSTARLVTRRVVVPLTTLREGAVQLRDTHVPQVIDLTGGVAELQDIAAAFNETAASLHATHGLLQQQARTDVLTGLPNRAAFSGHLRDRLADRESGPVSVLFVDLDDFKIVNDSLGHGAGDELLQVVADRLQSVVADTDMVARLGGDEFAMVIHGDTAVAAMVGELALAALGAPVRLGDEDVVVACSVGVSTAAPMTGVDQVELARQADFAMYMAKSQGKNCVEVFSAALHEEVAGRALLKEQLAQAVHQGQMVLHYQPVHDLESGQLLGFEALVRWNHPHRGLLYPGEFIELAEQTGDIVEIGRWVLDQACRDLAAYHRDFGSTSCWVSVNVSPRQLTDDDFSTGVATALARNAVAPGALLLEVTESVAITDGATTHDVLAGLRELGVRVALDDFGTGFSSLRYLHDLPIDVIKIDRSFISDASSKSDSMIEAIVELARNLDMGVIAEGIEHERDVTRLQRFPDVAGQGYHLGRPGPATVVMTAPPAGPVHPQQPAVLA